MAAREILSEELLPPFASLVVARQGAGLSWAMKLPAH